MTVHLEIEGVLPGGVVAVEESFIVVRGVAILHTHDQGPFRSNRSPHCHYERLQRSGKVKVSALVRIPEEDNGT